MQVTLQVLLLASARIQFRNEMYEPYRLLSLVLPPRSISRVCSSSRCSSKQTGLDMAALSDRAGVSPNV
jgi:hypothetical protein